MNDNLKRIQREVDEMNKSLTYHEEEDEGIHTDPPANESDQTQTDPPVEDDTEHEDNTEDEVITEAPTTTQPEDKDAIIADLRAKLIEKESKKAPASKPPTTDAPITVDDIDLIGEEDAYEISQDKNKLNSLLNRVRRETILELSKRIPKQTVLDSLPQTIQEKVDLMVELKEVQRKFYSENKDLEPFKNAVASVMGEFIEKDPNMNYVELLEKTAKETRERLGLKAVNKQQQQQQDESKPPRLPSKGTRAGVVQDDKPKTSVASQIEEMNKTLGR